MEEEIPSNINAISINSRASGKKLPHKKYLTFALLSSEMSTLPLDHFKSRPLNVFNTAEKRKKKRYLERK